MRFRSTRMRGLRAARVVPVLVAVMVLLTFTPSASAGDNATADFLRALSVACSRATPGVMPQAADCSFKPAGEPYWTITGEKVTMPVDDVDFDWPGNEGYRPGSDADWQRFRTPDRSKYRLETGPALKTSEYYINCSNSNVQAAFYDIAGWGESRSVTHSLSTTFSMSFDIPGVGGQSFELTTSRSWGRSWSKLELAGTGTRTHVNPWSVGWSEMRPLYQIADGFIRVEFEEPIEVPGKQPARIFWIPQAVSDKMSQEAVRQWGAEELAKQANDTTLERMSFNVPYTETRPLTASELRRCGENGYGGAPPVARQVVAAGGSASAPLCLTADLKAPERNPLLTTVVQSLCGGSADQPNPDLIDRQRWVHIPYGNPATESVRYLLANVTTGTCLSADSDASNSQRSIVVADPTCSHNGGAALWRPRGSAGTTSWVNDKLGGCLTLDRGSPVVELCRASGQGQQWSDNAVEGIESDFGYQIDLAASPDQATSEPRTYRRPDQVQQGWYCANDPVGRTCGGGSLLVNGTEYGRGLGLHAPATANWTGLPSECRRLSFRAGFNDRVHYNNREGDNVFRSDERISVWVGGQLVGEKLLRGDNSNGPVSVSIPVSLQRQDTLTIKADPVNGPQANGSAHIDILEPQLWCQG